MNIWSEFSRLSVKGVFMIGRVEAVDGNTSTLIDANNNTFSAMGNSVAVGKNAYVKDGIIQGEASESGLPVTVYV